MPPEVMLALATGTGLALVSSVHCSVMCGPLVAATHARGHRHAGLSYAAGRLTAYTALGAIAGGLGRALTLSPWARWAEAGLSWLLGAWLLHLGIRHFRKPQRDNSFVPLRHGPRSHGWSRILSRLLDDPLLLGAATALLPCGALFAAVTASAAVGSIPGGALTMATFAVLTGAAMALTQAATQLVARRKGGRFVLSAALIAGALVMFVRPLPSLSSGAAPACHTQGSEMRP